MMRTTFLEIRKRADGRLDARRLDGLRLTDEDKRQARLLADASPGITLTDVLRVFPGARQLTPEEVSALKKAEGLPQ